MGQVLAAVPQTFGYIGVEQPQFTVERDGAKYQIRTYPQLIAAEVECPSSSPIDTYVAT